MTRAPLALAALLLASAALLAGARAGEAGGRAERPELLVTLRPAAAAVGAFVRLDEVAELDGARAAEAAGVLLGRAPLAGQAQALTARTVGLRLEEEGFDARRFEVVGAAETVVRLATAPAGTAAPAAPAKSAPATAVRPAPAKPAPAGPSDEELRQAASAWLRASLAARLGCPADDLDVQVASVRQSGLAGALDGLKADVQWPSGRVRLGRQNAAIVLTEGDRPAGRLQVSLDAGVLRTVPVATRDLTAGRSISADDVGSARVRLTDLAMEIPTDAAVLPGMLVERPIKAGAAFDVRQLARQNVVRRGQPVTLVSEAGGVRITETVVARSDAALGEPVTVERIGGRKQQLVGKAAGQGIVRME